MKWIVVLLAALALTTGLAGAALAGGGSSGGGGSSSGGGSGGDGGGGGGQTTTACAPIASFTPSAGYYPGGSNAGAIWVDFKLRGCAGLYTVLITARDVAGVAPTNGATNWVSLGSGRGLALVWDDEPLPFDTTYDVELQLTDVDGNVVDSRSALLTTPKP